MLGGWLDLDFVGSKNVCYFNEFNFFAASVFAS